MSRKILFLLLVFCVTAVGCGSKSKKSGSATSGGDITISPATLKVAMPGVNYTQQLTATGGTAPYTWSAEGVLPGTVSLNSATGLLSGVPTSAGSYSFKVTVKDSSSPQLQGWRRYELIVTDGSIGWGRVSGNPVLDKGASGWDSGSIGMPCVIKESATSYKMWYTGTNTAPSSYFDFLNAETAIGLATSSDGVNWTKNSGNPVLAKNSNTSAPDSAAVGMASVIKDGSVYKMWYTGCKKESVMGFNYVVPNICYATSNDGINWTRYQSNPLIAGSVTYTVVSILPPAVDVVAKVYTAPWVIYDSSASLYKMWFTYAYVSGRVASTADMEKLMKSVVPSIGYATSPDGVNWTIQSTAVLTKGTGWESNGVASCCVIKDTSENCYKMWYTGRDVSDVLAIGFAKSNNGTSWSKGGNNPVFSRSGTTWESGSVASPSVLRDTSRYKMWYTGVGTGAYVGRIGYAECPSP